MRIFVDLKIRLEGRGYFADKVTVVTLSGKFKQENFYTKLLAFYPQEWTQNTGFLYQYSSLLGICKNTTIDIIEI